MDDAFGVPVLRINNLAELEDEDAFMKRCYGLAVEKDCSVVRLPEEFAEKLHSTPAYPRLHGREIDTAREEITQYDSVPGIYMREQYTNKKFFAEDFINPPKSLTPPFKTQSNLWTAAEQELFADLDRTQNKSVIYGSEQGYTLFPETFNPLNINKLTSLKVRFTLWWFDG
ncbi:hypothetical protein AAVH_05722 [Aphelenchoides avenae]|nr:hypothetical protein AAVH_05722 [Aphelenchus avenae]